MSDGPIVIEARIEMEIFEAIERISEAHGEAFNDTINRILKLFVADQELAGERAAECAAGKACIEHTKVAP